MGFSSLANGSQGRHVLLITGASVLLAGLMAVAWWSADSAVTLREERVTTSAGVVTAVSDGPSQGSWFWMYTTPGVPMVPDLEGARSTGTTSVTGESTQAGDAPVSVDFELEYAGAKADPQAVVVLSGPVAEHLRDCGKARVDHDVTADDLPGFARGAVPDGDARASDGAAGKAEATYTVIELTGFTRDTRVEPFFTQREYHTRERIVQCEFDEAAFLTSTEPDSRALILPAVRKVVIGDGADHGFTIVGRYMTLTFDGSYGYGESGLVPPTRSRDGEIEFRSDDRTWTPDVAQLDEASVHLAPADAEARRERDLLVAGVLLGVVGALLVSIAKTVAIMLADGATRRARGSPPGDGC